jgi:uncharacterized membrane protein
MISLKPLVEAGPAVMIHAGAALSMLVLGTIQMIGTKGTRLHRTLGYLWAAGMMIVAGSSFFIRPNDTFLGLGPIHLLSVLVIVSVPYGVMLARHGRIGDHRKQMLSLFFFALVVAGAFTLYPGRIMSAVVFGG